MGVVFWPGKLLDADEEAWLRGRCASLRRAEMAGYEDARVERLSLERYLPENLYVWSPEQCEAGAHAGPWVDLKGGL